MFHLSSFVIGYLSGAGTVLLARRFAPAFSELATAGYGLADSVSAMIATGLEDVEDMLAEARSRASAARGANEPARKVRVLRTARSAAPAKKPRRRATKKTGSTRRKMST